MPRELPGFHLMLASHWQEWLLVPVLELYLEFPRHRVPHPGDPATLPRVPAFSPAAKPATIAGFWVVRHRGEYASTPTPVAPRAGTRALKPVRLDADQRLNPESLRLRSRDC